MRNGQVSKWLFTAFYLVSGCAAKPYAIEHSEQSMLGGSHRVCIVNHGWHTGFVVPGEAIKNSVPQLKNRFADAEYVEFGWGDKGFYQAKEITFGLAVQALFWSSESVIHVVSVPGDVQDYFSNSNIECFCLNNGDFASLLAFISNSFLRNEAGEVVPQEAGLYGDSQFYAGIGDYYLMNTCNQWTAKGLQSAGFEISTTFKLTAGSIMDYLNSQPANLPNRCDDITTSGEHK
ncbi:TIGR02117 family protein [Alkalimarinus coralli]|uniref:TIGR02117 family protein n=1 Tax=Alkalimarinus coralli TaxID=2935863 RepID=UPI00202B1475|nr:TIGR02117 family protein [Alkalimarinus coralli]